MLESNFVVAGGGASTVRAFRSMPTSGLYVLYVVIPLVCSDLDHHDYSGCSRATRSAVVLHISILCMAVYRRMIKASTTSALLARNVGWVVEFAASA